LSARMPSNGNARIIPPLPLLGMRADKFENVVWTTVHPSLSTRYLVVTHGDHPVFVERGQPSFPRRLRCVSGGQDRYHFGGASGGGLREVDGEVVGVWRTSQTEDMLRANGLRSDEKYE